MVKIVGTTGTRAVKRGSSRVSQLCRSIAWCLLVVAIAAMLADGLQACPTCKDGMAQDPARMNMVRGYFYSILFMMSMPFVIFSSLGFYFYREMKRLQAMNAAASQALPANTVGS